MKIFNRCLKLYYAIDNAIYNNKKSLFEALIYLINKDRENKDHDEPIITDYDLVYLTLNNYINIYELKMLFLLQKNINDFDFKSMISEIEKIKERLKMGSKKTLEQKWHLHKIDYLNLKKKHQKERKAREHIKFKAGGEVTRVFGLDYDEAVLLGFLAVYDKLSEDQKRQIKKTVKTS
jgi:hypothetical protein